MAGAFDVGIPDLKAFRKTLRGIEGEKEWAKALGRFNRDVARDFAGYSMSAAQSMGGQQAHFANALTGRATQREARIEVAGPRTPKGKARANPAFWGTKAQGNWIGTSWDVGVTGQGPYAINDQIARRSVEIETRMRGVIDEVTRGAFPGGS